jgi:hypothetical protein
MSSNGSGRLERVACLSQMVFLTTGQFWRRTDLDFTLDAVSTQTAGRAAPTVPAGYSFKSSRVPVAMKTMRSAIFVTRSPMRSRQWPHHSR